MDEPKTTATNTPPTWAAFQKSGEVTSPSANPPSDYSYSPLPGQPAPLASAPVAPAAPAEPPTTQPTPPPSNPVAEEKKDSGIGGSIKSLLGFSKDSHQENSVPIQADAPTEVTTESVNVSPSPTPTISAEEQVALPPPTTDLAPETPASMSIPSFTAVPESSRLQRLEMNVSPEESPSDSGDLKIKTAAKALGASPGKFTPEPVSPTPAEPPSTPPPSVPNPEPSPSPTPAPTSDPAISEPTPAPSSSPIPEPSPVSSPPPLANPTPDPIPPASEESAPIEPIIPFAPLSSASQNVTSLVETPRETPPPSLPFPEANLSPTSSAPPPTPMPLPSPISVPVSPSSPPISDSAPAASTPPPVAAPASSPIPSAPTNPAPSSTPITPSPVPIELSPLPSVAPVAAPTVSNDLPSNNPPAQVPPPTSPAPSPALAAMITPAPAPSLPLPTQATPEPAPLTSQTAPIITQTLQAPDLPPETPEPSAPTLDNFPASPQPAPQAAPPADLNGFLNQPSNQTPTSPAVNFPGQQSPPITSASSQPSNGLRTLGDTSNSNFDLLANPPGSADSPPYLAPVAAPSQTQTIPQAAAAPPTRKRPIWPMVTGVAIALVLLGFVAYLLITRSAGSSTNPSTLGVSTGNQAILAESLGPGSWENNYSNSLLPVERGGLEFDITDPPSTAPTSPNLSTPTPNSDMKSLLVTITKVEAHLVTQSVVASGTDTSATQSASRATDHWETLRLENTDPVDLMDLRRRGGAVTNLGVTYLAAGHYTELRAYITQAYLVTNSGEKISLNITPDNGILKLAKPFDVTATGTVKLTADFNAPIMVQGSAGSYQFTPALSRFLYNGNPI